VLEDKGELDELLKVVDKLLSMKPCDIDVEVSKKVRLKMDELVLGSLGLSRNDVPGPYEGLIELVKSKTERAASLKKLRNPRKSGIGNLYHITIEDAELPVFSGEVNPLKIPEDVKADFREIWIHGNLDDRWRIVSDIFRDCKVFRVKENLYIIETLIKYEGYKYYIVKTGELAKKHTYIDDNGLKISEYENAWRKKPVRTRKGKKTWVRVLAKHSLILPEAVTIVNKMARDLIYDISNGRCFMCSLSVEATGEAIKLLSELKDNPEIWDISLWKREEIYSGKISFEEFLKLDEKCWTAIAPNYKGYNLLKDPTGWRSPENLEAFRKCG